MPYYCTVPRCTSMAGKAKNVSFHQFPRDEELARLWNDILKRGKPYTKYSKVCSLHFKPEDYTITSVGKNKGQWRTLRKDAVPSQNLPSETPAPYSRKQWETWSQNSCAPNVIDPTIHQQMAQAIYMQTMLAMQAAGTTDPSSAPNGSLAPETLPHSSHHNILKGKETNDSTSYKCTDCTKCFKDPDVFILHKRSHIKDIKTNGVEKENYNMNLTLRSNPILANLLKTNNEANFDPNMVAVENILMTALAANMDYLRNFSMIKEERDDGFNGDNCLNQAQSDSSGLNHVRSDSSRGDINRDSDAGDSNHAAIDSNSALNRIKSDLFNAGTELHCKGVTNTDVATNVKRDHRILSYVPNHKSEHESQTNSDEYNMKYGIANIKDMNHKKNDMNQTDHQIEEPCHMKNDLGQMKNDLDDDQNHIGISYAMKVETRNIENNFSGNYKERCFSSEYENDSDRNDFVENVNVQSHCDNDLNESMDSNSLVIDEGI